MPFTTQYGPGSFKPYWQGNILMRPDPRRAQGNIMGRPPTPPAMQQPQNAGGVTTPTQMGNQAAANAMALPSDTQAADSNQMNPFAQPSQYVGDMSPEQLSEHYRNNERLAGHQPGLLERAALGVSGNAAQLLLSGGAGAINRNILSPQADLLGINPLTGRPDYDPNQDAMLIGPGAGQPTAPQPGSGTPQPAQPTMPQSPPPPVPPMPPVTVAPDVNEVTPISLGGGLTFPEYQPVYPPQGQAVPFDVMSNAPNQGLPPATPPYQAPTFDVNEVTPFGQDGFLGAPTLTFPEYQPAYQPPPFAPEFDIMSDNNTANTPDPFEDYWSGGGQDDYWNSFDPDDYW